MNSFKAGEIVGAVSNLACSRVLAAGFSLCAVPCIRPDKLWLNEGMSQGDTELDVLRQAVGVQ